jgi:hypothetical protein
MRAPDLPEALRWEVSRSLDLDIGAKMPVSVVELREQARLLEADLTSQVASSDSVGTRAGVAVGFAGVLVGLLVQVKKPDIALHGAVGVGLGAAAVGLVVVFPWRIRVPDSEIVADLYERLPETQATSILSHLRSRAIGRNYFIIDAKRNVLSLSLFILAVAIALAAVAVL